jgi:putative membrane protein
MDSFQFLVQSAQLNFALCTGHFSTIMYSFYMCRIFKLVLTGFCMGAADIVPGVSGGTMALVLDIYEELVDSIRRCASGELWRPLLHGDIRKTIERSNWKFLVAVGAGILLAIALLSHLLESLLERYPIFVWSFFFGLVLASSFVVSKRIAQWNLALSITLVLGGVFAYGIVGLVPIETPTAPWFLLLSGAIAICAMILPGISGSFLLVILGKYEFILHAVNTRDFASLSYVALGAGGGILAFSHVLSSLLHRYHDLTIAFLTGLMLGSLRKVWPWKLQDINVLPDLNTAFVFSVGLMFLGCVTVVLLEKTANRR